MSAPGPTEQDDQSVRSSEVAGAGVLHKAMEVLDAVAAFGAPVRLSDLVASTGLPLGTLHRLLSALVRERLLKQDSRNRTYSLGSRIVDLAQSAGDNLDISKLVAPQLDEIAERTGESVAVALLESDQVIYRTKRDGTGVLRISVKVGDRVPLHASAAGKAVLAFMDPDQSTRAARRLDLVAYTGRTISEWDALDANLAEVRRMGFAFEDEEHVAGVRSLAAPLLDRRGYAIGAIAITGPGVNLTDNKISSWSGRLLEAAQEISVQLGGDPPHLQSLSPERSAIPTELTLRLRTPAFLGSSPLWDDRKRQLYWIDVLAPSLNCFDPATESNEVFPMDDLVGGIGLHSNRDKMIVALRTQIREFDLRTKQWTVLATPPADHWEHRFNKGSCDSAGRFWTSSMHMGGLPGAGCLFRLEPAGRLQVMETGFTLPNALAWSPDDRTLYLTDSAARTIFAFDFDIATGEIGGRRSLIKVPAHLGRPAGLTVDRQGFLWITHMDGWRISRFSPEGESSFYISLPVPSANGCGFGDSDSRTLYITTARDRLSPRRIANAPLSGSMFTYRTDVAGILPAYFGAGTRR